MKVFQLDISEFFAFLIERHIDEQQNFAEILLLDLYLMLQSELFNLNLERAPVGIVDKIMRSSSEQIHYGPHFTIEQIL